MIRLAALHPLLVISRPRRQVLRPVHPIDPGVDVVLVARADFQNARNPLVLGSPPRAILRIGILLALDAGVISNVDEAFAEVLGAVDWRKEFVSALQRWRGDAIPRRAEEPTGDGDATNKGYLRTKLLYRVISCHFALGSTA